MSSKCIVFDRDGTLIKYHPYLFKEKNVQLVAGAREAIKNFKNRGFKIFLHTNQSGVSRGYYQLSDVINCNNKMIELLNLGDSIFEKICIATDYPPGRDSYRKPSPKFGNEIINEYKINRDDLIYVGDNITDLETAENIGCKAYGVNYGEPRLEKLLKNRKEMKYKIFGTLNEVCSEIINNKKRDNES